MQTSELLDQLLPALVKARAAFPPLTKNQEVTVRGERGSYDFGYADLATVLQAVDPALSVEGLVLVSGLEGAPDGGLAVTTRLYHVSGQWLEASVVLAKPKSMQALGSAITYTRCYSVQALLGLAAAAVSCCAWCGATAGAPRTSSSMRPGTRSGTCAT
jgi:hypothetical protein